MHVELDSSMFRRSTPMRTRVLFPDSADKISYDDEKAIDELRINSDKNIDHIEGLGESCKMVAFEIPANLDTRDSYKIKLRIPHLNGYWRSTYSSDGNIVSTKEKGDMPTYGKYSDFTRSIRSLRRASWNRQSKDKST